MGSTELTEEKSVYTVAVLISGKSIVWHTLFKNLDPNRRFVAQILLTKVSSSSLLPSWNPCQVQ